MKASLTKKAGPLPVWGWALLAGGGLGLVLLVKRSKAAKAPEGNEPVPEHLSVPGVEAGGFGGGGGGLGEVKTPAPEVLPAIAPAGPGPTTATPVSEFLHTETELKEGGWERAPTGSSAPATASALSSSRGGPPRAGLPFRSATYKGHRAHEYGRAVPGGVGPGHRFIILPIGKKNHAAKGKHEPAHAKPKPVHHARRHRPPKRHKSHR